jgi:type II secretory pathway pseudopilin PulG
MNSRRLQRGATLLEAMVAMAVLMLGAAGAASLQRQSTFFMADARQATRAAAFGQDLAAQIELWDYGDPRLANTDTANDANPTDGVDVDVGKPGWVAPDHGEADLTAGGTTWTGLPQALLTDNGMERWWSVSYLDDANGNGTADAVRVTVIVRWRPAGARIWRHAVFFVIKPNTADFL